MTIFFYLHYTTKAINIIFNKGKNKQVVQLLESLIKMVTERGMKDTLNLSSQGIFFLVQLNTEQEYGYFLIVPLLTATAAYTIFGLWNLSLQITVTKLLQAISF